MKASIISYQIPSGRDALANLILYILTEKTISPRCYLISINKISKVIGIPKSANLIKAGMAAAAFILMLLSSAQAAYPPQADMSVTKEARIAGNATSEVGSGQAFDYLITVSNNDQSNSAPNVLVTDKLPYEVAFLSINASPSLGSNSIQRSGDLIYIRFSEIPANTTGSIIISVRAPLEAPTTLYNEVNVRYGNDPNQSNNRMTITTYVPLSGYDHLDNGGAGRAVDMGRRETRECSGCQ